jgi:hypothetical protein
MIRKPKDQGGLGVWTSISRTKPFSSMKNMHKFHNQQDIPWVNLIWQAYYNNGYIPHATTNKGSFWWRVFLSYADLYREHATMTVENGKNMFIMARQIE